jgi:hypothetical protein
MSETGGLVVRGGYGCRKVRTSEEKLGNKLIHLVRISRRAVLGQSGSGGKLFFCRFLKILYFSENSIVLERRVLCWRVYEHSVLVNHRAHLAVEAEPLFKTISFFLHPKARALWDWLPRVKSEWFTRNHDRVWLKREIATMQKCWLLNRSASDNKITAWNSPTSQKIVLSVKPVILTDTTIWRTKSRFFEVRNRQDWMRDFSKPSVAFECPWNNIASRYYILLISLILSEFTMRKATKHSYLLLWSCLTSLRK